MKFGILVARDFPGYKTISVEADNELHALRVLEEGVGKGTLVLDDGTPFAPEWAEGDRDRVVGVTRPDRTFAVVAPGTVVLTPRPADATVAPERVATALKYLEVKVPTKFDDQMHTLLDVLEMGGEVGGCTRTSHAMLLDLLRRLDDYSVFELSGTECDEDLVQLKLLCTETLAQERPGTGTSDSVTSAPTALPNKSLSGPSGIIDRQHSLLTEMEALLSMASAPGGIGEHEFTRVGGWREKAKHLVQRFQDLQEEKHHVR